MHPRCGRGAAEVRPRCGRALGRWWLGRGGAAAECYRRLLTELVQRDEAIAAPAPAACAAARDAAVDKDAARRGVNHPSAQRVARRERLEHHAAARSGRQEHLSLPRLCIRLAREICRRPQRRVERDAEAAIVDTAHVHTERLVGNLLPQRVTLWKVELSGDRSAAPFDADVDEELVTVAADDAAGEALADGERGEGARGGGRGGCGGGGRENQHGQV